MIKFIKNSSLIALSALILAGCGIESPRTRTNQVIPIPSTSNNPFPPPSVTTTTMANNSLATTSCEVSVATDSPNIVKVNNTVYAKVRSAITFSVKINAGLGKTVDLGKISGGGSESGLSFTNDLKNFATGSLTFNLSGAATVHATLYEKPLNGSPREITCMSTVSVQNIQLTVTGKSYARPTEEIVLTPRLIQGANVSYALGVEDASGNEAENYEARWDGSTIRVSSYSTEENRNLFLVVQPLDSSGRYLPYMRKFPVMFLKDLNCRAFANTGTIKYGQQLVVEIKAVDGTSVNPTTESVTYKSYVAWNPGVSVTPIGGNALNFSVVNYLGISPPPPVVVQVEFTAASNLAGATDRTCKATGVFTVTP